jgi:hypothetical protein
MKFLHLYLSFLDIFALLDPDLADKINADPDPQHWFGTAEEVSAEYLHDISFFD